MRIALAVVVIALVSYFCCSQVLNTQREHKSEVYSGSLETHSTLHSPSVDEIVPSKLREDGTKPSGEDDRNDSGHSGISIIQGRLTTATIDSLHLAPLDGGMDIVVSDPTGKHTQHKIVVNDGLFHISLSTRDSRISIERVYCEGVEYYAIPATSSPPKETLWDIIVWKLSPITIRVVDNAGKRISNAMAYPAKMLELSSGEPVLGIDSSQSVPAERGDISITPASFSSTTTRRSVIFVVAEGFSTMQVVADFTIGGVYECRMRRAGRLTVHLRAEPAGTSHVVGQFLKLRPIAVLRRSAAHAQNGVKQPYTLNQASDRETSLVSGSQLDDLLSSFHSSMRAIVAAVQVAENGDAVFSDLDSGCYAISIEYRHADTNFIASPLESAVDIAADQTTEATVGISERGISHDRMNLSIHVRGLLRWPTEQQRVLLTRVPRWTQVGRIGLETKSNQASTCKIHEECGIIHVTCDASSDLILASAVGCVWSLYISDNRGSIELSVGYPVTGLIEVLDQQTGCPVDGATVQWMQGYGVSSEFSSIAGSHDGESTYHITCSAGQLSYNVAAVGYAPTSGELFVSESGFHTQVRLERLSLSEVVFVVEGEGVIPADAVEFDVVNADTGAFAGCASFATLGHTARIGVDLSDTCELRVTNSLLFQDVAAPLSRNVHATPNRISVHLRRR
jgi:hypothetical protein